MRVPLLAMAIVGALTDGASSAVAQSTGPVTPARPDITGYWHYNAAKSDNPASAIPGDPARTSGGSTSGFGGSNRGGMGGSGGGGGMGGRPGTSEAGRDRIRQTMQLAMNAPSTLRISRNDSMITLVEVARADTVRLRTNGKKVKEQVEGGGDLEVRAEWKEDGLIIERKVNGGGKVTETYFRSSDNRQMMVIVKVETSRTPKPIEFRRVYDSIAEGS